MKDNLKKYSLGLYHQLLKLNPSHSQVNSIFLVLLFRNFCTTEVWHAVNICSDILNFFTQKYNMYCGPVLVILKQLQLVLFIDGNFWCTCTKVATDFLYLCSANQMQVMTRHHWLVHNYIQFLDSRGYQICCAPVNTVLYYYTYVLKQS